LEKEKKIITVKDYPNKKDYDDRVRALNNKISEIDSINTESEFENIKTELIERQKAIAQIKASRNLSKLLLEESLKCDLGIDIDSSFLIKKLLETGITDLVKKANPKDNSSLHCELQGWKEKLAAEAERIRKVENIGEELRKDSLSSIYNKIEEIDGRIKNVDWHKEFTSELPEQKDGGSESEAVVCQGMSLDESNANAKYSSEIAIQQVIERAYKTLWLVEKNKPTPLMVFREIHNEFLYKNYNKQEKRQFDKHSIIQECEDSLVKGKPVLKWKKWDGEVKPMSASAFSATVENLKDGLVENGHT
jgi:hypothetical protein